MANDFTRLGFLAPGTDVSPIVPALEAIWQNSLGKGLSDFNFRSVTGKLISSKFDVHFTFVFPVDMCQHYFSTLGNTFFFSNYGLWFTLAGLFRTLIIFVASYLGR